MKRVARKKFPTNQQLRHGSTEVVREEVKVERD
jgi:hypothetical protein